MIRHARASFALTMAAAGILVAGQAAPAQTPDQAKAAGSAAAGQVSQLTSNDKNFVIKAAQGSMAEIKMGQLAQERGSSENVKTYGQQTVQDHTKALDELKQIAQSKNITLPDGIDAKDQGEYDRLSKLSGTDFDHAYLTYMKKDHKKDVSEFKKQAERGKDPDIKSFASSSLPTLETHLRMAETDLGTTAASKATSGADQPRTDTTGKPPTPSDQTQPPKY